MNTRNRSTGRWMALGGAFVLGTAMLATAPAQAGLLDKIAEKHIERRVRMHERVRDALHGRDRHRSHRDHRDRHRGHRSHRDRHRAHRHDRHRDRHHDDRHRGRGHRYDRHDRRSRHFVVPRVIRHQHRPSYRSYYSSDAWYGPHRHNHAIYSFPVWDGRDYRYAPYAYCEGELWGEPRDYYYYD